MGKYRTEKRKARVGERILITKSVPSSIQTYKKGDVLTVYKAGVFGAGDVMVVGQPSHVDYREYEVIVEETAPPSEILTRIAAIESELAALKALAKSAEPAPTGNAARKAVIEKARAFASGHTRFAPDNVEFYVNTEKGVVTALKKSRYGTVLRKAFARCAPGDVFNADIGKAIAVGRLYGVEVPAEFFDAPKPDEVVVGMRVRGSMNDGGFYSSSKTFIITNPGRSNSFYYAGGDGDWLEAEDIGVIIDDTEAQY